MKKSLIFIGSFALLTIAVLIFKPVSDSYIDDCERINASISKIYKNNDGKIIFKFKNDTKDFIIDSNLKISIDELRLKLLNQKVDVWYFKGNSIFKSNKNEKKIARIKYFDELIYNEISDIADN